MGIALATMGTELAGKKKYFAGSWFPAVLDVGYYCKVRSREPKIEKGDSRVPDVADQAVNDCVLYSEYCLWRHSLNQQMTPLSFLFMVRRSHDPEEIALAVPCHFELRPFFGSSSTWSRPWNLWHQ